MTTLEISTKGNPQGQQLRKRLPVFWRAGWLWASSTGNVALKKMLAGIPVNINCSSSRTHANYWKVSRLLFFPFHREVSRTGSKGFLFNLFAIFLKYTELMFFASVDECS